MRPEDRTEDAMRQVRIEDNYICWPPGSALISFGKTRVLCTTMFEDRVPPHCLENGTGWVTAEYGMLPGCSHQRIRRPAVGGKPNGRSLEIQRLIGRSLRAVVNLKKLGQLTAWVDCDVMQADGGTRTASITGAAVALWQAFDKLCKEGRLKQHPMKQLVCAISVGIVNDMPVLDLEYEEDVKADVDMNVVFTEDMNFVEVQGTGEKRGYSRHELDRMLELAAKGAQELFALQREKIGS